MSLVLWADDDGQSSLSALESLLDRRGLVIEKKVDFTSARKWIEEHQSDRLAGAALLVDVILPHALETGALNPYLGLKLARVACEAMIGAVCFLTVIRREEIQDGIEKLEQDFGHRTKFKLIDKLDLLQYETLESLAAFLREPSRRLAEGG